MLGRPLVFLDVDGPLIPFRARTVGAAPPAPDGGNPLLHRIDPEDGRRLRKLPADLVWATTWMDEANEVVAPRLGLPPLPVVDWPDEAPLPGLHWKTAFLVTWAAGRSFVWIDDELTDNDRRWVAAHHPGRALLHRVDGNRGLTDADFFTVGAWLMIHG
ncbi:hypothetical protein ACWT_2959 [Actinoplanes sp. SE50]|uniref:HAD domain-containing protein n=1 Tax=unclassified Actinoplanes TaxID=2626549 RepID=UPI00023EBB78|nr:MULTISPECIES: HAD domain-containing protein [unclassified Actinoplanes]AEV83981.1 hypothetical protein ACPL_3086 [Actinoplanes sp. SE50/110]ATO82374.1 hypothetical protein ACWT_2959 [Actinoplanes sp. SE50]SLL99781.1 hypothetical protein ACSP50_3012 [Actinoplanes sp. SE50/110]